MAFGEHHPFIFPLKKTKSATGARAPIIIHRQANAFFFEQAHNALPVNVALPKGKGPRQQREAFVLAAHTHVAIEAVLKGLGKLLLNEAALKRDLDGQWAVVAEGIQTILRRAGYPEPYERLKELTRGKERIGQEDIIAFIDKLDVRAEVKQQLHALSPHNYTGIDLIGRG